MDAPIYPYKSIHNIKTLSLALGEPANSLENISQHAFKMYRYVPQKKKNGETRDTYDAHLPLKLIQRKIVDRILSKITFPYYLHGGIKDPIKPRSIHTNVNIHSHSKNIILQDIKDFYPSITSELVYEVFKGLFGFEDDVAKLLTNLTTKNKRLPQGASTSGYLANLIFWDVEPSVVKKLESQGLHYTRFADDITITSHQQLQPKHITTIISTITNMLAKKGCYQKRTKLHIRKRGQSLRTKTGFEPLTITGLSIYNHSPSISKEERRKIRAAVHEIENLVKSGKNWIDVESHYSSTMGRIGRLIFCSHPDGQKFKDRLNKLKTSNA